MNDAERELVKQLNLEADDHEQFYPSDKPQIRMLRVAAGLVEAKVKRVEDLEQWQQRAIPWLQCGTRCQCQGEWDCELKALRRQAAAATKGERDATE